MRGRRIEGTDTPSASAYQEIVEGIRRGVRREGVRDNFLGVLPLIRDHFDGLAPAFVQSVERRDYPVGRGLLVPFDPPLIYGVDGRLHFPWFSFWRSSLSARMRLSLYVTMVDDVLFQDPDLETAKFEILDFSAPKPKEARELTVIDARNVPRVSEEEKTAMLAISAEGFFLAQAELAGMKNKRPEDRAGEDKRDGDQPGQFD